ncbi:hypothetical protein Agub_g2357 [Astrephomene gubernaculifera]|uniref:protein-S-isoprenylcysteine alpha-carbonyl methylesterase n=1 Tax=Astrephomene gubernaculifera TaxID=47775 RepID=A0AAD3HIJ5_9CHLO|nr:hypothetical protein Agub_g2357 [Astrephomene gubernaculifera]
MRSQATGRSTSLQCRRSSRVTPPLQRGCSRIRPQILDPAPLTFGDNAVASRPSRHADHASRSRVVAMSFLSEAFKGAKADIDSAGNAFLPRLARTLRVARILGAELAAIVALAPYGAYAMSVYRRLPSLAPMPAPQTPPADPGSPSPPPAPANQPNQAPAAATETASAPQQQQQQQPLPPPQQLQPDFTAVLRNLPPGRDGVAVHRQVSYGPAPRNTLDIYVPLLPPPPPPPLPQQPPQQPLQQAAQQPQQLLPVVFFVHGGVWASGETWQYAPMATRLAQAGMVVVVPTYTLYPEALAGTMVEEVSAALTWTFDNVRRYGGDPDRITASGHSAGGHLVAWALLRRAAETAADRSGISARTAASSSSAAAAAAATAAQSGSLAASHPHPHPHHQHPHHQHQHQEEPHQPPQGSAAHAGDRLETAAYLLGGAGPSLPGALHALRAVAGAQLHPTPGVDSSYEEEEVEGRTAGGQGPEQDGGGGDDGSSEGAAAAAAAAAAPSHAEVDTRMPRVFVGMSAVYDIAKHYEFEKSRAVHELSMMKRAVGGPAGFAAASPSVILARAAAGAEAAEAAGPLHGSRSGNGNRVDHHHASPSSYYTSFELLGDAITARAGLAGAGGWGASSNNGDSGNGRGGDGCPQGMGDFSLAAARRLPPFVVMGSCADHMVPWHEGAELVDQLRRCSVPVRHLLYNHIGHGDFVMPWRPMDLRERQAQLDSAASGSVTGIERSRDVEANTTSSNANGNNGNDPGMEDLLPCARDFLLIAMGRVQPVQDTNRGHVGRGLLPSGMIAAGAGEQQGATGGVAGDGDGAGLGQADASLAARSRL